MNTPRASAAGAASFNVSILQVLRRCGTRADAARSLPLPRAAQALLLRLLNSVATAVLSMSTLSVAKGATSQVLTSVPAARKAASLASR